MTFKRNTTLAAATAIAITSFATGAYAAPDWRNLTLNADTCTYIQRNMETLVNSNQVTNRKHLSHGIIFNNGSSITSNCEPSKGVFGIYLEYNGQPHTIDENIAVKYFYDFASGMFDASKLQLRQYEVECTNQLHSDNPKVQHDRGGLTMDCSSIHDYFMIVGNPVGTETELPFNPVKKAFAVEALELTYQRCGKYGLTFDTFHTLRRLYGQGNVDVKLGTGQDARAAYVRNPTEFCAKYVTEFSTAMNKHAAGADKALRDITAETLPQKKALIEPKPSSELISAIETYTAAQTKSVEIAYWNAIKDDGNANMYKAYLKRFPDGQFVDIANLKIDAVKQAAVKAAKERDEKRKLELAAKREQDAERKRQQAKEKLEAEAAKAQALEKQRKIDEAKAAELAITLPRRLQAELNRVGCNAGPVDGKWGSKSEAALKRFGSLTGASAIGVSEAALDHVKSYASRVCPVATVHKASVKPKAKKRRKVTKHKPVVRRVVVKRRVINVKEQDSSKRISRQRTIMGMNDGRQGGRARTRPIISDRAAAAVARQVIRRLF